MGKDESGKKTYHPKHYLLWFLNEIKAMMNSSIMTDLPDDQQFTISYGALWRLIKSVNYIKYRDDMPENTCTCEHCENLDLLLTALSSHVPSIPKDGSHLMKVVMCNPESVKCVDFLCEICSDGNTLTQELLDDISEVEEVLYYKWITGEKFPEKKQQIVTGSEAASDLKVMIKSYRRHHYNRFRQHKEMKKAKECLLGSNSAIIQVDFAENYVNTQRNAIQTAYFGQENFTLYTACVWYDLEGEVKVASFCIVSDSMDHSRVAAFNFNSILIDQCKKMVPGIRVVYFWSDGCAAQFKSKYCFAQLTSLANDNHVSLTWSYFESHHGKGPVDGVGGKVKSSVYKDVKAGIVVISSPKQFAEYANQRLPSITTMFVSKNDIKAVTLDPVPDVPGTRQIHFVFQEMVLNQVTLTFFKNSQFEICTEEPFRKQVYSPQCTFYNTSK